MPHKSLEFTQRVIAKLKSDTAGQDLVEYAMLSGFMVIALWALFPTDMVPSISGIFSRLINIASVLVP